MLAQKHKHVKHKVAHLHANRGLNGPSVTLTVVKEHGSALGRVGTKRKHSHKLAWRNNVLPGQTGPVGHNARRLAV